MSARLVPVLLVLALCACSARPKRFDVAATHARVDRLLDQGKSDDAERILRDLLRHQAGPHQKAARKDTHFRLAQVALQRRDPRAAVGECDAGLAQGKDPDLFTANLYILRGNVHESLHDKAAAVEDFRQALLINETLLGEAVKP
jgi:predicted negative regulator of RcsB-dependent stress response